MPTCYLLALSKDSSLDHDTNNWSLFTLIEEVQILTVPMNMPFQVHIYWLFTPDELNIDLEMHIVLDILGEQTHYSDNFILRSTTMRHRLRIEGIVLPSFGEYRIGVEWHRLGSEAWTKEPFAWPLTVKTPANEALLTS